MNQTTVVAHNFDSLKELALESYLFVKMIYYMDITKFTLSKYMHEFIIIIIYFITSIMFILPYVLLLL